MKYQEIMIPVSLKGSAYMAVLTDQVLCGIWQGDLQFECQEGQANLEDKLLELRVFSEQEEFRVWRQYRGEEFRTRYINDSENRMPFMDEVHMLDQNSTLTKDQGNGYTRFVTTGGGVYYLPGGNSTCRVKVRTYFSESEETNGIQIPKDWRIVAFGDRNLQNAQEGAM